MLNIDDNTRTILIINDGSGTQEEVISRLTEDGYNVKVSPSCKEGMKLMEKEQVDLVLLDVAIVDKEGIDAWENIKDVYPELPVVTVSFSGAYRAF
ncbi:MAG: response regulator [Candidatus Eremiobacteraeota bacterium]|nr:response regulator [Candidatus Eremiobacteraeota bacterium]